LSTGRVLSVPVRTNRIGGTGDGDERRWLVATSTARAAAASDGATTKGSRRRGRHPFAPPAEAAASAPPPGAVSVNAASVSAAANDRASSNRSAGSRSSALARAAATLGGTDLRSVVTGWASSVRIRMMTCCAEEPTCGGFPVSISYSTQPSE
jgi:hypothetical protein